MFKSLRWRLTFWFVSLTAVVYVLSAMYGAFLFREGLTNIIEDELEALMSEIEPAIELSGTHPTLHQWAKTSLAVPFKFLPTIQLYDKDGALLERYGPSGLPQLYKAGGELETSSHAVKVYSTPLIIDGRLVGYLQIQLNLRSRDRALNAFTSTLTGVAPYLFISLGIVGYAFSSLAARPIEQGFEVLRRFMTDAGHELGTPIAIIQANAELLEPEVEQNEFLSSKLSIIVRSTERLGNLVQDLTLLSKMESPQLKERKINLEFDKLVRAVVEDFQALFAAKGIKLGTGKMEPSTILGEPESLKRLVMNLLQNALRYTESGGEVTVALDHEGRSARLLVSDTGIGIPEESLPKIFERFYRVEKSRTRAAGGAGLGLSIVRAIVELHRGRIDVASKVGAGTTFTVTIPLR